MSRFIKSLVNQGVVMWPRSANNSPSSIVTRGQRCCCMTSVYCNGKCRCLLTEDDGTGAALHEGVGCLLMLMTAACRCLSWPAGVWCLQMQVSAAC